MALNAGQASPTFVRVPHPTLSLWQSTVRQVVANHLAQGQINAPQVTTHPLVQAADAYAYQQRGQRAEVLPRPLETVEAGDHLFEIALAHAHDVVHGLGGFAESIGHFSKLDPLFVECIFEFVKYYWLANRQPQYRDWKQTSSRLAFGMIGDPVAAGARVALIGDWGTGMPDAKLLLEQLLLATRPAVLIHLGDVYYSGTPAEVQRNFTVVLAQILKEHPELDQGLRVYGLPGNHDYYAGGGPFYRLIDSLNSDSARQTASYFCLRTEDDALQFLGMDTGFNDRRPGVFFDKAYAAPMPHNSELEWLHDKLDNFPGSTILLSHHQVFSAHSTLNGSASGQPPYLNKPLADAFSQQLPKVAAWFWGHEHNLVVFADNQFGIRKGRLVGCSAFEMGHGDDPYQALFEQVGVQQVQLGKTGPWFNHGCAVIDLAKRSITYYQMASWTDTVPTPRPQLEPLYTEPL